MPLADVTADIEAEINSPVTRILRRADIYEADGETLFYENAPVRDGSVTVDASSTEERRNATILFHNEDGRLDRSPTGLWYDKRIKLYRGLAYRAPLRYHEHIESLRPFSYYRLSPDYDYAHDEIGGNHADWVGGSPTHVEAPLPGEPDGYAVDFDGTYHAAGPTGPDFTVGADGRMTMECWVKLDSLSIYSVLSKYQAAGHREWWLQYSPGWNAFYFRYNQEDGSTLRVQLIGDPGVVANKWYHVAVVLDEVEEEFYLYVNGIEEAKAAAPAGTPPSTPKNSVFRIGAGAVTALQGQIAEVAFYDEALSSTQLRENYLIGAGEKNLETDDLTVLWQIGDFLVDKIDTSHFGDSVSVSCRDLTKKLIRDKFGIPTAFSAGSVAIDLIETIARNGGIENFNLGDSDVVTGKDFVFEPDTTRWGAIREIAGAYSLEVFFDAEGILVVREFQDPAEDDPVHSFQTGEYGNLATYSKSVGDARLYNDVVVTGEGVDPPVVARATNTDPDSPTNIFRIGVRTYRYNSGFITKEWEAQRTADNFLKVVSLEEYEINMDALVAPWLEAGNVVEFIDPDPDPGQEVQFFMHNFTIPMLLGPMQVSVRRVLAVK